ncbi:MAG: hypothetical protein QM813_16030 [Verrucomicrobiota bacterium]
MWNRLIHTAGLTLLPLLCCWAGFVFAAPEPPASAILTNAVARAELELVVAHQRFAAEPTNSIVAWQLGRACFTWGKMLSEPSAKEKIYTEGVAACRRSIALNTTSAPSHYYLGMNIGRIADLKRNLSAFSMVKEVERSFQRARSLDERYSTPVPTGISACCINMHPVGPLVSAIQNSGANI